MTQSRDGEGASYDADVVIVGGGIAGLCAGVALAAESLRVIVLERDAVLGGRARTVIDRESGDALPIGPHVFLEDYTNLRALLEQLGTQERVVWQKQPQLPVVEGRRVHDGRLDRAPPPLHFLPVLRRLPDHSPRALLANLPALLLALQTDEHDVQRLDALDAAQALRKLGVPPQSQRSLWSFIARNILNVPLERCSAGALFRFCRFLLSRPAPRFGFPDRGLGDVFAPAARRAIERAGGVVQCGVHVERILTDGASVQGVRLAHGTLRAPCVIAATPADALLRILPAHVTHQRPALAALADFKPVPYLSVFLWFDRKLTERRFWARSFRTDDFGSDFYDLSNIYRGYERRPSLLATNVIDSGRIGALPDAAIVERVRAELAELLPDARRDHLLRATVHHIPMAVHTPHPGSERVRPDADVSLDGLILAGDWTRTGLPSCMEGAALSGWRAAERALLRIGRARALVRALPPPGAIPAAFSALAHALPLRPVDMLLGKNREHTRSQAESPLSLADSPTA
jgi:uncharacterized protein with NAD-binding domain and iron-sulfur cluster